MQLRNVFFFLEQPTAVKKVSNNELIVTFILIFYSKLIGPATCHPALRTSPTRTRMEEAHLDHQQGLVQEPLTTLTSWMGQATFCSSRYRVRIHSKTFSWISFYIFSLFIRRIINKNTSRLVDCTCMLVIASLTQI